MQLTSSLGMITHSEDAKAQLVTHNWKIFHWRFFHWKSIAMLDCWRVLAWWGEWQETVFFPKSKAGSGVLENFSYIKSREWWQSLLWMLVIFRISTKKSDKKVTIKRKLDKSSWPDDATFFHFHSWWWALMDWGYSWDRPQNKQPMAMA